MDIRSSLEVLKSIFGAGQTETAAPPAKAGTQTASTTALTSDQATFSHAANGVASADSDSDVRQDKVASIQAQLAAGTYNVPASAVAGKLVQSLLDGAR